MKGKVTTKMQESESAKIRYYEIVIDSSEKLSKHNS